MGPADPLDSSGDGNQKESFILRKPAFFSISMVASKDPPVASMGSMIRAVRSSIPLVSFW